MGHSSVGWNWGAFFYDLIIFDSLKKIVKHVIAQQCAVTGSVIEEGFKRPPRRRVKIQPKCQILVSPSPESGSPICLSAIHHSPLWNTPWPALLRSPFWLDLAGANSYVYQYSKAGFDLQRLVHVLLCMFMCWCSNFWCNQHVHSTFVTPGGQCKGLLPA